MSEADDSFYDDRSIPLEYIVLTLALLLHVSSQFSTDIAGHDRQGARARWTEWSRDV